MYCACAWCYKRPLLIFREATQGIVGITLLCSTSHPICVAATVCISPAVARWQPRMPATQSRSQEHHAK